MEWIIGLFVLWILSLFDKSGEENFNRNENDVDLIKLRKENWVKLDVFRNDVQTEIPVYNNIPMEKVLAVGFENKSLLSKS
jgi:hypothetical protein